MASLAFGMIIFTRPPASPVVFWMLEVVVQVAIWRAVVAGLGPDVGAWMRARSGSNVLSAATVLSAVVFLILWSAAVVVIGGRAELLVIVAYAIASGVLLFLVSLPNRRTEVAFRARMPLLVASTLVASCVGFLYLVEGAP